MGVVDALGVLVALAFSAAVFETLFGTASHAAIPNLVPEERLSRANSTLEVAAQTGFLIGPLIGGALASLSGVHVVFLANAASFLVSAALVQTIVGAFVTPHEHRSEWRVLVGLSHVMRHPILRGIAACYFAASLGIGITIVANVPLADDFDVGSFGYGALIAVWGAGSAIGALAARGLTARSEPTMFLVGCSLVAVSAVGVGISPSFSMVLFGLAVMGGGDGVAALVSSGLLQRSVPDGVRSRVAGALGLFVNVALVASYVVAPAVLRIAGAQGSYIVGGIITFLPIPFVVAMFNNREDPNHGTASRRRDISRSNSSG